MMKANVRIEHPCSVEKWRTKDRCTFINVISPSVAAAIASNIGLFTAITIYIRAGVRTGAIEDSALRNPAFPCSARCGGCNLPAQVHREIVGGPRSSSIIQTEMSLPCTVILDGQAVCQPQRPAVTA